MQGSSRNLSQSSMRSAKYRNPNGPAKYFAPYRIRKHLDEISIPDIEYDLTHLKSGLNGKVWEKGGHLKDEVRQKLLKIANLFYESLKLPFPIKDIYFTGSLSNYNWTNQSDMDIHLMLDIPNDEDMDFIAEYIDAKKDNWKAKHNITIYGFPVELYAKDSESEVENKSIYSIKNDKWVSKPSKKKVNIDIQGVKEKSADMMSDIDNAIEISDDKKRLEAVEKIKDKIKKMRSSSLEQGGEYSTENLTFKVLRNAGYLDKLSTEKANIQDKDLTLKEYKNKSKKDDNHKFKFGCLMLYFDIPKWSKITDLISKEDIYDEPSYGLETEPHVTLLFGLHDDEVNIDDLKKVVRKYANKPITVQAVGLSTFQNEHAPYDVVKLDIKGDALNKINKALKKHPHTSSFPDYHPHMTIAYVKKGMGPKYEKKFKKPIELIGDRIVYSKPDKTKINWSLIKKNILKVQKNIPGMTDEKIQIIKDFINFTCAKLGMEEPVTVVLRTGRDEYISTTAAYAPHENENHIRCGGRALIDILGSIGHELTHNRQRELGKFKAGEQVQNIGGEIEDEANAMMGILKKDFTHNYGYDKVYDI
jgi:hypothetical protein